MGFTLRWSLRELRARWLQVAAVALVIAIGTGTYAALGSTATWRRVSNDESYAALRFHDLRVVPAAGTTLPAGTLRDAIGSAGIPAETIEERLIGPVQVDASTDDRTILVSGRVVGVDLSDGGPRVNRLDMVRGRALTPDDDGEPVALLESRFADAYGLPDEGVLQLGGAIELRYVGAATSPEYFVVVDDQGTFFAERSFGVLFVPLATAGRILDAEGRVNDAVVALAAGADADAAAGQLADGLSRALPEVGFDVLVREDDLGYSVLYEDIESDQAFWNLVALLVLAGAAFAAFNLVGRIVEAQRRQIGIGMALGATPVSLAVRPLLMAAEIAVLGVLFGVGIGVLAQQGIRAVFEQFLPLPVWRTAFQPRTFAEATILGLLVPFLASAWPVWRAVRVTPVEAIRTGHLAAKGGGLAPLLKRLPLPGSTLAAMPIRNTLRAPRRTLLTSLGIAAVVTVLVVTFGLLDTFDGLIDRGEREALRGAPERTIVRLSAPLPIDDGPLGAIGAADGVATIEPVLTVAGQMRTTQETLAMALSLIDLDAGLWTPTIVEGVAGDPGIVLAEKAAEDLGVGVGDTITVRHPSLTGPGTFGTSDSELPVAAIHGGPFRVQAYLDDAAAAELGLAGLTNEVWIDPEPGVGTDRIRRSMFAVPGVASVETAAASAEVLRDLIEQFTGIFRILQLFVLALALLIAFNATAINADERAREHATMFAFGVTVSRVLRIATIEGVLVGLVGTLLGILLGLAVTQWFIVELAGSTLPDVQLLPTVSIETIASTIVLGIVAVAVAPLLTVRRLHRMDIPGTLRVME
jgi:putative ABC transport system permease protein